MQPLVAKIAVANATTRYIAANSRSFAPERYTRSSSAHVLILQREGNSPPKPPLSCAHVRRDVPRLRDGGDAEPGARRAAPPDAARPRCDRCRGGDLALQVQDDGPGVHDEGDVAAHRSGFRRTYGP